jgi:hypothetical protein
VTAQLEIGLHPLLESREAELFEPEAFSLRERDPSELGERRPSPQRKRLTQGVRGALRVTSGQSVPTLADEPLEALEVERIRLGAHPIAGGARLDALTAERLPQLRDVHLEGRARSLRRLVSPNLVDQAIARDDAVRVQEEESQERALLPPAERYEPTVLLGLERAKDAELHVPPRADATTR